MTEKQILKLIKFAKTIPNSKIHIGIEISEDNLILTFMDSVSLEVTQESLQNKTFKEAKAILKSYKTLSEN